MQTDVKAQNLQVNTRESSENNNQPSNNTHTASD
jgi:hypothetical protein